MSFPFVFQPEAAQVWHLSQQIHDFERFPRSQQLSVQAASLGALFHWASLHSPFWRERLSQVGWCAGVDPWQVLNDLPILTRSELQEHGEALSCASALPDGSCSSTFTTGSTGRPVSVLKQQPAYTLRYLAYALRCTIWHQINIARPLLRLGGRVVDRNHPDWGAPEAWFGPTGPALFLRSTKRDISELYRALVQRQPGCIVTTAAVLNGLAKHALTHYPDASERPQVDVVMTTGETVSEKHRQECREAFGARIINRYTNDEVGWLAVQCPKHEHLHVMSSNVVLEIVDAAGNPCKIGQPGKVLLTALHSEAMPLIRYDVGDVAEWGDDCDCGIHMPVIKRVLGRQNAYVELPTGEFRYVVPVSDDFLAIAPFRDWRLRHYSNPLLRAEVVSDTMLTDDQRQAFKVLIQQMLGYECPVLIEQCAAIEWGETDKRIGFMTMSSPWVG